jgi:hypothetical protein
MVKFKPIAYNEGSDFGSYKFVGASAVLEGRICAVASSDLNTQYITAFSGTLPIVGTNVQTATILQRVKDVGRYFPIYHEDPDIENVGATISTNDFVVGFFGQEWEVHESCTESGYASTWTSIGQRVAIGSNGKFTPQGAKNATAYLIAECTGTFGAAWIRMKRL